MRNAEAHLQIDADDGVVRIGEGIYGSTRGRAARIELLREAGKHAARVEVHAPLTPGAHLGRIARDLPRLVFPRLGEPGDRSTPNGFVHAFFDDEPILKEAAAAGLVFVARDAAWVRLEHGSCSESPAGLARELRHVLALLPTAERLRHGSPAAAVAAMRRRGRAAHERGPMGRARLRRAIGSIDAASGANCFRRTLLEIGLDAGSARATLVFGLDVGRTGHVALAGAEDATFDVSFEIADEHVDAARGAERERRMRYYVTLDPNAEPTLVDVNELPTGQLDVSVGGRPVSVDVVALEGALSVRVDGRIVDLTVEGQPPEIGAIVSGHRSYVRVESERQRAAAAAKKTTGGASEKVVKSPMPGRVIRILVAAGSDVEAGATLCVIEAMKMENEVKAKAACKVVEVLTKEGATVEGGAKLFTLG